LQLLEIKKRKRLPPCEGEAYRNNRLPSHVATYNKHTWTKRERSPAKEKKEKRKNNKHTWTKRERSPAKEKKEKNNKHTWTKRERSPAKEKPTLINGADPRDRSQHTCDVEEKKKRNEKVGKSGKGKDGQKGEKRGDERR
jgi:hypothetical protein